MEAVSLCESFGNTGLMVLLLLKARLAKIGFSPAYAGTGLQRRSSIKIRTFRNRIFSIAASAIWNVTYRP